MGVVNRWNETRREGTEFKTKDTKRNSVSQFRETLFSYFFSFAKRSKLGETVTCFVQFPISRNLKKYATVNPTWNNTHPTGSFDRYSEIPGVSHEETGPYRSGVAAEQHI